jgi:dCTP deaminase
VIGDKTLRQLVDSEHRLVYVPITRFEYGEIREEQYQPASLDVRLSHDLFLYDREPQQRWDLRTDVDPATHRAVHDGSYFVAPGECVLGSLVERVQVPPSMVGWVEGKSSIGRQFLKVHSAGFIDPGFHGDITLELKNESSRWGFELKAGMVIAQLRFAYLDAPAVRPYGTNSLGSHYQMQIGTTEAR